MGQVTGSNNLNKGNDIRISLIAAANSAATSNPYIVAGVGLGAAKTLPLNMTMAGDYSIPADWYNFCENVPFLLAELRMETSNTVNWENTSLVIGERMPNGQNPVEKKYYMNEYQESTGNGLKKSIKIPREALGNGEGLIITPQTYIRFDGQVLSSTITVYLRATHTLRSYVLDEASF